MTHTKSLIVSAVGLFLCWSPIKNQGVCALVTFLPSFKPWNKKVVSVVHAPHRSFGPSFGHTLRSSIPGVTTYQFLRGVHLPFLVYSGNTGNSLHSSTEHTEFIGEILSFDCYRSLTLPVTGGNTLSCRYRCYRCDHCYHHYSCYYCYLLLVYSTALVRPSR